MNAFTIRDIENLTGIKAHTIRIWEQRYKFLKPARTLTNIRFYNTEEFKSILKIVLLQRNGYNLSDFNEMSSSEIDYSFSKLKAREVQVDKIIIQLICFIIDLDIDSFELLLDREIETNGFEQVLVKVIFPFLEKFYSLSSRSSLKSIQNSLLTNIIRQKLLVALDALKSALTQNKLAILFLTGQSVNELGLLYINYLLKIKGIRVLYLGAHVTLAELNHIVELKRADYLITHLTHSSFTNSLKDYISNIKSKINITPVVITGYEPDNFKFSFSKHVLE